MKNISRTKHGEITEWAMKVLKQTEMKSSVIVETPWSTVLKINTQDGPVYLKQTPSDLFIEFEILKKCRDLCQVNDIPEIIKVNESLRCGLMKSCGEASLRTMFNEHLNVDLLINGLQVYRKIQQATAPHVDGFIQLGVPDWRLERFPKLYHDFVSNEEFLLTHGLEMAQVNLLQEGVHKIKNLSQALLNYGILPCLDHSDFHENNMLFNNATKKISIIDLGETAINHPLFSLAAFLKTSCERYNIMIDSMDYQKLYTACFNAWLDDKESMTRVVELINGLLPVCLLFAQKRFLDAIHLPYNADNPVSVKQHNKIHAGLIWLIHNMKAL